MFKNYLKTAWAVFKRRKFFTFVNLFGIVFTLAVLLTGVTFLDNIFGAIPPEVNADRTVGVYMVNIHGEYEDGGSTNSNGPSGHWFLRTTTTDLPGVERVSIFGMIGKVQAYREDRKIESWLKYTDSNFFRTLEFDFIEGRAYTQDEYDNADNVVVINKTTRDLYFNGESAVGKTLLANGRNYRVVGVVKNISFLRIVPFADIWAPTTISPTFDPLDRSLMGNYMCLIEAKDRASIPLIQEEYEARISAFDMSEYKPFTELVARPESFFETAARNIAGLRREEGGAVTRVLTIFALMVLLFMLLPTINLVNLNVSRILERASEIGVRKAFGAPSKTLIGQFIIENMLLTLFGGVLALGLAWVLLDIISATGLIPYANFSLNIRVFGYALLMVLVFGFLSGVYPAWRMSKMNPVDALQRREQ
ncbi:ABC transporter permease [bacterium]|nr:ABC transporter permease [bacterium]